MKTAKYALAVSLVLVGLIVVPTAPADDIVNVTISDLTFTGLNACSPAPLCSQSLTASFQWDNSTNTYVSGTETVNANGAIGSMAPFVAPILDVPPGIHAEFKNTNGDDIAIWLTETAGLLAVGDYPVFGGFGPGPSGTITGALICTGSTGPCNSDYPIRFQNGTTGALEGGALASSGMAEVSPVPEPSSLLLLGSGLLGLVGAMRRKWLA